MESRVDQPRAQLGPHGAHPDAVPIGVHEVNLGTPWLLYDFGVELLSHRAYIGNPQIEESVRLSVTRVFREEQTRFVIPRQRHEVREGWLEAVLPLALEPEPFVPGTGTVGVCHSQERDCFARHRDTLPD